MLAGWCYVAFDSRYYSSHSSGEGLLSATFNLLSSIGRDIPKARWFSEYFSKQGQAEFAAEITRVYGFIGLMMAIVLFVFALSMTARRGQSKGWSTDTFSQDGIARLDTIGRLALGTVIFGLHFCIFGLGLETRATSFPAENADGSNVIGLAILSYSFLAANTYYAAQNRRFVRFYKSKQKRESAALF
jgi:hypothetical protein